VKRQTYFLNKYRSEDSSDESDDYADPGLNAPKRSPMRRKEKFRNKDKQTGGKHKDRKRNDRSTIRYDFDL
jgi:hypothetical protein